MPSVLKNTQFLKLWGNQILLQIGFNMCNYTALLIIAHTAHSPFIQSQFYAALIIPSALFGMIAGPVVDMVNRKRIMLITDILLAILFFSYALVSPHIYSMMLVGLLTALVAAFFTPAEAATIPLIVKEEELNHANSFMLFTLMGAVLLGYALAGPIIQVFGGIAAEGAIIPFVIGGFLLLCGFLLRLSLQQIETQKPILPEGGLIAKPIKLFFQTVLQIKKKSQLFLPLVLLIFVEFIIGMMSVLFFEYISRYLQLPLETISYVLLLPLVFGLVVGISALGKVEKRYGHRLSIFTACLGIGLTICLLGITPNFLSSFLLRIFAVVASFASGTFLVFIAVQSRTILQKNTPHHMQGRVFSFLGTMTALATPLPVLLLGFIADRVSLLKTLDVIGVGIMSVLLIANYRYTRYSKAIH